MGAIAARTHCIRLGSAGVMLPHYSALKVAVEALYDAADDDSATGGPDLVRGIYPTAVTIDADGAQDVAGERIVRLAREVIASRSGNDEFGLGGGPSNQAPRADS
jgi:proteasome beta subunit